MELAQALELVWQKADRSSQGIVAKQIGVHPSALTRWKQGEEPTGKLRAKLMTWAEGLVKGEGAGATGGNVVAEKPAEMYAAIARARTDTEANLVRLSEISGYAKGVLAMMQSVTSAQARVVDSLAPWVIGEELHYADPQVLADANRDLQRDAKRKQSTAAGRSKSTKGSAARSAKRK